jgi:hypothetical protein
LTSYAYCEIQDVKDFLKSHDIAYVAGDPEITTLINSKSDQINRSTRRIFSTTATTEYYDGNGKPRMILDNYPIQSVSEIKIYNFNNQLISDIKSTDSDFSTRLIIDSQRGFVTLSQSAVLMFPIPLASMFYWPMSTGAYPYTLRASDFDYTYCFGIGYSNVVVTYTYGYTSIPDAIREAAYKMVVIDILRKKGATDSQGASSISITGFSQTYSPRGATSGPYGSLIEELQQDINAIIGQYRKSKWGVV